MDDKLKQEYHKVYMDRGGKVWACCDLCKSKMHLQIHHVIERSLAPGFIDLISVHPLLALLCDNCHDTAHTTETRAILLRKNAKRYGKEAVIEAVKMLDERMKSPIMINIENILEE